MDFKRLLKSAKNLADIFQLVKEVVRKQLGTYQAGLLLGLSDLGNYKDSYLGAFYSFDANTIVINKGPLQRIKQTKPSIYKPYLFHVMLHEYLHSLGIVEEKEVRPLVHLMTKKIFGEKHVATQIAGNLEKFMPNLTFNNNSDPPEELDIEFIRGIDRENTNYIM
jgi:hypothetical protein